MRTASRSTLLNETSLLSDPCVRVTETSRPAETMNHEPEPGLIIVLAGLVEPKPVAAPELTARVRASLRAMTNQTTRWSRLDA